MQGETAIMSKPVKSEAELIAMAKAELKVHADCPDGIVISVLRSDDSWEFRASADAATVAKPGYPECVAMLVQIGDHLRKQYDVSG
jgi:urease accessory protein UreF